MGVRIPAASGAALVLACTMLSACSGGGGGSPGPSPAPAPAPVDSTPPDTTLATAPTSPTSATSATFTFTATETSTFDGRLDGAGFAAVTSPHTLNNLAEGSHTFEVRARDSAGNTDASPASSTWTVDTTPPDTQVTVAPSSTAVVNSATFTVTSTETGGAIEASINGGAFGPVTIPYTPAGLADGTHTIQFRARDAANNVDASPVSAGWTLDATPAQVRLLFPARNFYTDAATVTVRGTASDPNGVNSVSVNGVAATTTDNYAHWTAVIPVPVATTPVSITSRDVPGNNGSLNAATMMNRGPYLPSPRGIGYDARRNRVIVNDSMTDEIVAFNRTTGIGTLLSPGSAPGTTPGSGLHSVEIDAVNDRALSINSMDGSLVAIDLATGARSIISANTGSSSPTNLISTFFLALDAAHQHVYAGGPFPRAIVRIDLATGARSVVSSDTVGTGDALADIGGLAYDDVSNPASPRLLVVNRAFNQPSTILSVDLATGNRTHFSSPLTGTGVALVTPISLEMDPTGRRVLVSDINESSLLAVDLATGNRSLLSSFFVGTGPFMYFHVGLDFDPVGRILFSPQSGGFGQLDSVTQLRRIVAHADVGGADRVGATTLVIEQTTGIPTSLLYLQPYPGMIYRLNLDTSNRAIISWDRSIGAGPSLENATHMVLDTRPAANGRAALVLTNSPTPRLLSVDLVTGDRTLITSFNVGMFDNNPGRMALDVANNRVLITNNETLSTNIDELYAINLASGAVSMLSGPANTGPTLIAPYQVVLEPGTNPTRALISDYYQPSILGIDLATGDRSVFDSAASGSVTYTSIGPMVVDAARSRLLAYHIGYPANIFWRPLAGGARQIISGADPTTLTVRGTGPALSYSTSLAVDSVAEVGYSVDGSSVVAVDLVSGDRVVIAH